jgi:hypothetical protein
MNHLLARLITAHPALFRGEEPDTPSHVLPGWYDIIDKLCSNIEAAAGEDIGRIRIRQVNAPTAKSEYDCDWGI